MADERVFVVTGSGDGTTVVTEAMPWLPPQLPNSTTADFRYRTLDAPFFGLFGPAILGRKRTHSLVRAWADGAALGDVVQAIGSNVAADAFPTGQPRGPVVPIATGPELATIVELDMTDWLKVTTVARKAVHLEVLDLDEQQKLAYLLKKWGADQCCGGEGPPEGFEQRSVGVPPAGVTLLPLTTGTLFVDAFAVDAVNGILTLPSHADTALGSRILIRRGAGENLFRLAAGAGDTINDGTFGFQFTEAHLSVIVERSQTTWVLAGYTGETSAQGIAGSANLAVPTSRLTRISWQITADAALTLPDLAFVAVDQEFEIAVLSCTQLGGIIIPTAGQKIDLITDYAIPVAKPGDSVYLRAANGTWLSYTNGGYLNRNAQTVTADPALAASTGWRGMRVFLCNYAADGNFTLPTNPLLGTEVLLAAVAGAVGDVTIVSGGGNTIICSETIAPFVGSLRFIFTRDTLGAGFWLGSG